MGKLGFSRNLAGLFKVDRMMLVRKTLGYLRWLLVLLPACVYIPVETSPYRGFDREFEAGESTREQIIDVLGVPNLDRQDYRYMLYEWESDGIYIAHPIIMCGNVPPAGL